MDSNNERDLERFFREHGVEFEVKSQWLRSPITGRPQTPDFYIPATKLYIEVKGKMTLEAIERAAALTDEVDTYYLYNCDDYDWLPNIHQWPKGVLDPETAKRLDQHAWDRKSEVRAASRSARRYSKHDLAHSIDLQQQELLILARDESIAEYASTLTDSRLASYIDRGVSKFSDMGLLHNWTRKE